MPLFTVITVVLNDENGIEKTVVSLSSQTYKNFEFIIIDGGSVDKTLEICKRNICFIDQIVSEVDNGLYDAMNKGIARATGTYLIFMNSGDCFYDRKILERFAYQITLFDYPDFVYGDASEKSGDHLLIKPARSHKYAWYGMFTHHQSMFYKRTLLADLRYDTSYPIGADYDFTLAFLKNAKNIIYLPYCVCIFERGGVSSRNIKQSALDLYRIRKSKFGFNSLISMGILFLGFSVYAIRKVIPRLYEAFRFRQG